MQVTQASNITGAELCMNSVIMWNYGCGNLPWWLRESLKG